MAKIRALVVDDEPLARERIVDLLRDDDDVEVVDECANGLEAVAAFDNHNPDLMFLDVQMPDLNGFETLEAIGADNVPAVVFVTAYDQYAIKAFEYHALDYLLKPFDRDRFNTALARAKAQLGASRVAVEDRLSALLDELRSREGTRTYTQRFVVKEGGRVFFLRVDEIDWIAAAANYVTVHAGRAEHLLRDTMTGMENKLDPEDFLRIHRSTIVNVDRVESLEPMGRGEYEVILKNGVCLNSSRGYRPAITKLLGNGP